MSTVLIEIRRAKASDAVAVADTHDEAWRGAYQGVIPGLELEKLVTRRGPDWWDSAIRKGSRIDYVVFIGNEQDKANQGRLLAAQAATFIRKSAIERRNKRVLDQEKP